jgi:hypothetical protein
MMSEVVENILAHYGVKGMHWGRRSATSTTASEDHARATSAKKKARSSGVKALSNKELQDAINRMNLEQQYNRLNPSTTKKAVSFVADILLGVGKQEVIKLVSGVAAKQVAKATKK